MFRVKYQDPLLRYVDLMHEARKAETEYEQDKHNKSFCNYVIRSGVVTHDSEGLPTKDDLDVQASQWAQLTDM